MNTGTSQENTKPMRLVIIASIVSSVLTSFLLLQLNGIVHGQLYNFGLQFSLSWALEYWSLERAIYACQAVSSALCGSVLVYGLLKRMRRTPPLTRKVDSNRYLSQPSSQTTKENSMLINCPKCRKVFGRPLSMLDFTSGKAELVSVCPYCSHILGSASETDLDNVGMIYPNKTEIEETQNKRAR